MIKLLSLTGIKEINDFIKDNIKKVEHIKPVYGVEELYERIESSEPDVIFLLEIFNSKDIDTILIKIKKIVPHVKIIYVSIDSQVKNEELLNKLLIKDIFYGTFSISQLEKLINVYGD